jgi:hypothetical protein
MGGEAGEGGLRPGDTPREVVGGDTEVGGESLCPNSGLKMASMENGRFLLSRAGARGRKGWKMGREREGRCR